MAPCDTSSLGSMTSAARLSSDAVSQTEPSFSGAGYQRWRADQLLPKAESISGRGISTSTSARRLPLLDVAINQPLDRGEDGLKRIKTDANELEHRFGPIVVGPSGNGDGDSGGGIGVARPGSHRPSHNGRSSSLANIQRPRRPSPPLPPQSSLARPTKAGLTACLQSRRDALLAQNSHRMSTSSDLVSNQKKISRALKDLKETRLVASKTAESCRPMTGDMGSFPGIAFNMEMMQSLNSAMEEIQGLKEALDWERKLRCRAEKCRLQACRLLATSKADSQKLEDRVSALTEEITQLNSERLSIVRGARVAAKRSTSYIMRFNELQGKVAGLEQQLRDKDKIIAQLNLQVQSLESERRGAQGRCWCSRGKGGPTDTSMNLE